MKSLSWESGQLSACTLSEAVQRKLLLCSMYSLRVEYAPTGWQMVTPEEAADALGNDDDNLFVFVGYNMVCLTQCRPWFSAEDVITEEFVDQDIPLETVVEIMQAVARLAGCRRFSVGTRAAANQRHAGLARLYQRQGLAVSTVELMGVVHEQEDHQEDRQV